MRPLSSDPSGTSSLLDSGLMLPDSAQGMQDLRTARAAFIERGLIEPSVRPPVWQCWRRCRDYGINLQQVSRQAKDPEKLTRARAASQGLLAAAEPVMSVAHAALGDQAHVLALADRAGIVLRLLTDPVMERAAREIPNIFEGASWAERDVGCNGIGTALTTDEPVVLIGPEHLVEEFLGWSCIGVPLHGPDGAIVGAFDLSVPTDETHAHAHIHAWGWTLRVAQTIEAALTGTPPSAEALAALRNLGNPLNRVLGTLELLLRQAGLSSTYARFLDETRQCLNATVEQLQADRTELQQADEKKDRFLAALSHDLRNPLSALHNALEVAKRTRTETQLDQARVLIARQAEQISRLADDLLDFLRIAQGELALRTERVDVMTCVQHAVEMVQPLMRERQHDLTVSLPEAPLWLDADPARLHQVLVNLLTNAAKYTPEGGQIRLAVASEDAQAVIQVQDNGIGIAPERLAHIFEPLGSVDHPPGRICSEGLGLGLSVARRLVELHGGRIKAESAGPGRGSVFTVRLPIAGREQLQAERTAPGPIGRAARRILVIEDNPDVAESFAVLLRTLGHAVEVAADGAAGLAAVRRDRPDLVFLDIGLPDMDGYAVARRLRAEHGAALPLVALTGYGQEADRQRARAAGFDRHLLKPVRIEELENVLDVPPQADVQ